MSDVVVTVPKTFTHSAAPGKIGLAAWLAEGDPPGSIRSRQEWFFTIWNPRKPDIKPGERVYVVCEGRLVGYAPLVRLETGTRGISLVRRGGAVACTIAEPITGFRGVRYRWWDRSDEVPLDLKSERTV